MEVQIESTVKPLYSRPANSHYIVVSLKILQQISSSHYYVANTHYKYI